MGSKPKEVTSCSADQHGSQRTPVRPRDRKEGRKRTRKQARTPLERMSPASTPNARRAARTKRSSTEAVSLCRGSQVTNPLSASFLKHSPKREGERDGCVSLGNAMARGVDDKKPIFYPSLMLLCRRHASAWPVQRAVRALGKGRNQRWGRIAFVRAPCRMPL